MLLSYLRDTVNERVVHILLELHSCSLNVSLNAPEFSDKQ